MISKLKPVRKIAASDELQTIIPPQLFEKGFKFNHAEFEFAEILNLTLKDIFGWNEPKRQFSIWP